MNQNSSIVWANIAGKMSEIAPDQLAASLTLCVAELGSDIVVVDLRHVNGQPDVMKLLASRLVFPDYFGGNLDALFDVVRERASVRTDAQTLAPQTWLIKSTMAQQKMLFPIADTLRDAMSDSAGVAITILWMVDV